MASHEAQRVVADRRPGAEQDHRQRLEGDAVLPVLQGAVGHRSALAFEPKRAVPHRQRAAGQPQQAMPVGVGNPGGFQPQNDL